MAFFLLLGCQGEQKSVKISYQVYGKLMEIMQHNQLQARVNLNDLQLGKNSYGLGAMEDLQGEILISQGEVITSVANPDSILVQNSNAFGAALLVTTEVEDWQEVEMNETVDLKSLESVIEFQAETFDLNANDVIPFKIEANPKSLNWHIINASLAEEQNHQAYKESGRTGVLESQKVEIIGFYSKNHQGVFTHHGRFLHLHFITADGSLMGHVDNLQIDGNWKIYLPKAAQP